MTTAMPWRSRLDQDAYMAASRPFGTYGVSSAAPRIHVEAESSKRKSIDLTAKTLTWKEEMERQRRVAERKSAKKREQREKNLRLAERGQGPLADGNWNVSTDVIDSIIDELNPHERSKPLLPISSGSRRRAPHVEASSNSEDDAPRRRRTRSGDMLRPDRSQRGALGNSSMVNLGSSPCNPRSPQIASSRRSKPTLSTPVDVYSPTFPATPPVPTFVPDTKLLSIDEIVKRHSTAVTGAVAAVKEKARQNAAATPRMAVAPSAKIQSLPNLTPKRTAASLSITTHPNPNLTSRPDNRSPERTSSTASSVSPVSPSSSSGHPSPYWETKTHRIAQAEAILFPETSIKRPASRGVGVSSSPLFAPVSATSNASTFLAPKGISPVSEMSTVSSSSATASAPGVISPVGSIAGGPLDRQTSSGRSTSPSTYSRPGGTGLPSPLSDRRRDYPRPIPSRIGSTPEAKIAVVSRRTSSMPVRPIDPEELSIGSVAEDVMIGQTLLDQLEQSSVASSPSPSIRPGHAYKSSVSGSPNKLRKSISSRSDSPVPVSVEEVQAMAEYLASDRLNVGLHLPRPFPARPLHVSLADVGDPNGRAVVMFLGVGCVRHLIALFDDLARALKLRLICIDRWGFGKTTNVAQDRRSPSDWAMVVDRVLSELDVDRVSIIAHSAGAPYAAAVALRLGRRVQGRIHFLAPWVSSDIDGGYKWLKWVPNGVIKSAFAAEWRLQSYRLGKPPPLPQKNIGADEAGNSPYLPSSQLHVDTPSPRNRKQSLVRRASQIVGRHGSTLSLAPDQITPSKSPRMKGLRSITPLRANSDPSVPSRSSNSSSLTTTTSGDSFILKTPSPTEPGKPPTTAALLHALEQASHAECEPGTTDDIMTIILNRPHRSWGFEYSDLRQPVTIWWGTEDDKISENSVRWMERSVQDSQLKIVPGEDHNLMRSVRVMYEVFTDLAA